MSIHIDMKVKDVLEAFFYKVMQSPDKMGDYNICPEYGESSGNYRFRFVIIKVDGDYVLATFKILDPRTSKIPNYFIISYPLISYNGNSDNEVKVLEAFKLYSSCVKAVISFSNEGDFYNNNFYNMLKDFKEMDKSAWRSKKGINKLSKLIDFKTGSEDIVGFEEAMVSLSTEWARIKKKKFSHKSDVNLIHMARKSDNIKVFSFWYKGILVGFSIGVIMLEKYICLVTTKTISIGDYEYLSKYLGEEDESIVKSMNKHLGSYVQYEIHKWCLAENGLEAVYYYGDVRSKSLREFKTDYYKNIIYYQRVPLIEGEVLQDE
jgi:hypothetical protein